MTERQARILYKALYHLAGNVFKKYDPCQIRPQQEGIVCADGNGCCGGCPHLGPKGCTVMSLGCRLWLCQKLQHTHPLVTAKINMIRALVSTFGLKTGIRTTIDQDFRAWGLYKHVKYIPLKQVLR